MGAVKEKYLHLLDALQARGAAARVQPDRLPSDEELIRLAREVAEQLDAAELLEHVDDSTMMELRDAYDEGRQPGLLDFDAVVRTLGTLGVAAHVEHTSGGAAARRHCTPGRRRTGRTTTVLAAARCRSAPACSEGRVTAERMATPTNWATAAPRATTMAAGWARMRNLPRSPPGSPRRLSTSSRRFARPYGCGCVPNGRLRGSPRRCTRPSRSLLSVGWRPLSGWCRWLRS